MSLKSESWKEIDRLLDLAMDEDIGTGDATTEAIVPEDEICEARFVAREPGVLAGMEILRHYYTRIDPGIILTAACHDGSVFPAGAELAVIGGRARAILTGERVALNILQRMCGVASLTHRYVKAIEGTSARVYDTRKTLPGWRALDKLAVFLGGGENHRRGLFDMVLIKDNHIRMAARQESSASVAWAVRQARAKSDLRIQVEVDTLEQLREVLPEEPDMILLDNMGPDLLREAIQIMRKLCSEGGLRKPLLEASGGITLQTIRAIAETGVERISVGAITHSAVGLDIGLDM